MIDIEIIDSLEDVQKLEARWKSFFSETGVKNIFLSYEWVYNWFNHCKGSLSHFIVTGPTKGNRTHICPCALDSGIIYPAGFPASAFIDIISVNGANNSFLDALCSYLSENSSEWNFAFIKTVREDSLLCNYFIRNQRTGKRTADIIPYSKCPVAEFHEGWNIYLNELTPKFRSNLRRREKIASEYGDVSLSIYRGDDLNEKILTDAVSINLSGRKSPYFKNQNHIDFFTSLIKSVIKKDIFIAFLSFGEIPIAYKICFSLRDEVWEYNTSFNEEYHRASPGLLLTAKLIEKLSAEGIKKYNFLKGDEPYKSNFANYSENLYILTIKNKRFLSLLKYFTYVKLRMFLNRSDALTKFYDRLTG